jgi:DNA-binding transcriptional LysR family regulator
MTDIRDQKIRQLDGALLLIFQTLVRQRRTTAAAERLGLSQPAISHALARLRRLFDDPLFVRRPHGLEPTPVALELAPKVDAVIEAVELAFGGSPRFDPASAARSFRIDSPDFAAGLVGPALHARFRREAPGCRFAIGLSLGEAALRRLRNHETDLAIGQFLNPPASLVATPMFSDRYVVVLREGHPAMAGSLDAQAFQALDWVAVSVAGDYRTPNERSLAEQGLSRRIVAAAPRFSIAFAMVAASDAGCIAPRRLALAQAEAFGLVVVETPSPLRTIEVIAMRRAAPDAGVDWLVDAVREAAG